MSWNDTSNLLRFFFAGKKATATTIPRWRIRLAPKGFETRLVQVRLAGLTSHAVCYVTESKAYLDYNNRQVFFTMTRSSPALRQIAEKVARSLNANWTVAFEYEFSYEDSRKRIMARVVRVRDPRHDPPPQKARPQADRLLVE